METVPLKRVFESVLVDAPMSLENDINVALVLYRYILSLRVGGDW